MGDVTVTRGTAPIGSFHGFIWTITFETQVGNVKPITVDGNSTDVPLAGPNTRLGVVEVRRGKSPSLDIPVAGLEPGTTYFTRVSAINDDGFGPTTLARAKDGGTRGGNNDGLGVAPLSVVAHIAPSAPTISGITAVSASQLEVVLDPASDLSGMEPLGYKVRATAFGYATRGALMTFCTPSGISRAIVRSLTTLHWAEETIASRC